MTWSWILIIGFCGNKIHPRYKHLTNYGTLEPQEKSESKTDFYSCLFFVFISSIISILRLLFIFIFMFFTLQFYFTLVFVRVLLSFVIFFFPCHVKFWLNITFICLLKNTMAHLFSTKYQIYFNSLKLKSHGILHYLWSEYLSNSFCQLVMSIFIFSQYSCQQILKPINRLEKCGVNPHCLYFD